MRFVTNPRFRLGVHHVISGPREARLYFRAQHAAEAVHELEILHNSAETVTPNLSKQRIHDSFHVLPSETGVQFVVLQTLECHDWCNLAVSDELATQVQQCS